MSTTIRYLITGLRGDVRVNALLRACDLGIDAAGVPFQELATVTGDTAKQALWPDAIKAAYERTGCTHVEVQEL